MNGEAVFGALWRPFATMLHMGQPERDAKSIMPARWFAASSTTLQTTSTSRRWRRERPGMKVRNENSPQSVPFPFTRGKQLPFRGERVLSSLVCRRHPSSVLPLTSLGPSIAMASGIGAHMTKGKSIASHEKILLAFETFRSELDDENDRRERIVKVFGLAYMLVTLVI